VYWIFYAGQFLLCGTGMALGAVAAVDGLRRREEYHVRNAQDAYMAGYWLAYGQAWKEGFQEGSQQTTVACRELAMTTADMIGLPPHQMADYADIVSQWDSVLRDQTQFST
jgi:hypothetical protein